VESKRSAPHLERGGSSNKVLCHVLCTPFLVKGHLTPTPLQLPSLFLSLCPPLRTVQLKNGLTLVFLVLVDAATTCFMFFTREGKSFEKFLHEIASLTSADTFKGGTGDLLALLALRIVIYACAGALAITLGGAVQLYTSNPVETHSLGSAWFGDSTLEPMKMRNRFLKPFAFPKCNLYRRYASGGSATRDRRRLPRPRAWAPARTSRGGRPLRTYWTLCCCQLLAGDQTGTGKTHPTTQLTTMITWWRACAWTTPPTTPRRSTPTSSRPPRQGCHSTPGGCQIGYEYMGHTGCHQLNRVLTTAK
jgi:hypothetical protein